MGGRLQNGSCSVCLKSAGMIRTLDVIEVNGAGTGAQPRRPFLSRLGVPVQPFTSSGP
jgi:hypothetical protein